ncbi:hypothetical protein V1Y59_20115 [Gordonia sp. PKS22-38]|uniref:Uncharacterized protein n=1 Tax=Gordonia prachuapensis TaxID=3115651 RepID=A0ABU7MYL4_9ACTN|nr:hypothetical protein [Gordonia sp. PKS22-38]
MMVVVPEEIDRLAHVCRTQEHCVGMMNIAVAESMSSPSCRVVAALRAVDEPVVRIVGSLRGRLEEMGGALTGFTATVRDADDASGRAISADR